MNPAFFVVQTGVFEWACFAAALVLCVLLRLALPQDRRRRLRSPLVFLGLYLVLTLSRLAAPGEKARRTLGLLAAFLLILALVRILFTILFDALTLTRGRFPKIVQDILLGLAYFIALMGLFNASGVELSSILTTSALLTAVIAFALQDTLGNVIGGLAIQIQRPFSVGDWVSIDGNPEHYGTVMEINWRVTRIVTNELVEVLIPNAIIAKSEVVNFSQPSKVVRRGIRVTLSYDVPPSRVEEVALRAMRSCPGVLDDPPPECVFEGFGDSGVGYWCRFFIDEFRRRDVIAGTVGARLYYEFLREGIDIPYPIRTVHLYERTTEQERLDREDRIGRLAERFQSIDFLAPLGPEVLTALARRVRTAAYGSGEAIVREGDAGSDFYLIERGEVSVVLGEGGKRQEIARLEAGDFFGEMSLMTGEVRRATVLALGAVEAVRVDKDSFREVLSANPKVVEEISRVLALRQTALEERAAATPSEAEKVIEGRSRALVKLIRGFFRL